MSSRLIRIPCIVVAWTVITQASCRETSGPGEITREATLLAAASPTSITATVGSAIQDLPSVIAQDSNGNPTPGVVVTFAIVSGGGSIAGAVATSNSAGIARVGAWTLGSRPGMNVVTAGSGSLGSVTFRASAVAGPATQLVKVRGDNQIALPGAPVVIRPQVIVIDAYGNGVSGTTVTFAVESGGGSLVGTTVISDPIGIATVGSWTLGPRGSQSVMARSGNLAPAVFTAIAYDPALSCGPPDQLPEQIMTPSELTVQSCKSSDGRYFEHFLVTLTDTTAYLFTLESTDFDAYLELQGASLTPLAGNNDRASSTTNSWIKALLPPGIYTLVATSFAPDVLGRYTVSFGKAASSVDRCEEAFIARGVTTHQVVTPNDCVISPTEIADRFRIYLKAGSTVIVQVDDRSYSDPRLELVTPRGEHVSAAQIGFYVDSLTYTASVDGYYVISVIATEENQYVLSVR